MANKAPRTATMGRAQRQPAMRASSGGNVKRNRSAGKRPPSGKGPARARKKKKSGMSLLGKIAIALCVFLLLIDRKSVV